MVILYLRDGLEHTPPLSRVGKGRSAGGGVIRVYYTQSKVY